MDNLVGTNTDGIKCKDCKDEMELIEIDGDYVSHFKCKHCYSSTKSKQLDRDVLKKSFANTYKYCGADDEHFRLLLRKGVYPYEYMDSFERFKEQALPSIDRFYSELNLQGISKLDYLHAKKVWEKFEIRDLADYHDLYLSTDVMLLMYLKISVIPVYQSMVRSSAFLYIARYGVAGNIESNRCATGVIDRSRDVNVF